MPPVIFAYGKLGDYRDETHQDFRHEIPEKIDMDGIVIPGFFFEPAHLLEVPVIAGVGARFGEIHLLEFKPGEAIEAGSVVSPVFNGRVKSGGFFNGFIRFPLILV